VVDGVMYFTTPGAKSSLSKAATAAKLWFYDPQVPPEWGINACCDVVNRGRRCLARQVFAATLDGRLVALDAGHGKTAWETLTVDRN